MAFLPSLPADAALLHVFKRNRSTAVPLLDYHEALLRGASPLSVGERELIAGFVSGLNACSYCHGVHEGVAREFGMPAELMAALLADIETAAIDARMKPVLRYVKKLTLTPARLTQADADAVFAAGWNEQALYDAISVCALFNFMNRLVEGLGIKGGSQYASMAARRLHDIGYAGLKELLG